MRADLHWQCASDTYNKKAQNKGRASLTVWQNYCVCSNTCKMRIGPHWQCASHTLTLTPAARKRQNEGTNLQWHLQQDDKMRAGFTDSETVLLLWLIPLRGRWQNKGRADRWWCYVFVNSEGHIQYEKQAEFILSFVFIETKMRPGTIESARRSVTLSCPQDLKFVHALHSKIRAGLCWQWSTITMLTVITAK